MQNEEKTTKQNFLVITFCDSNYQKLKVRLLKKDYLPAVIIEFIFVGDTSKNIQKNIPFLGKLLVYGGGKLMFGDRIKKELC